MRIGVSETTVAGDEEKGEDCVIADGIVVVRRKGSRRVLKKNGRLNGGCGKGVGFKCWALYTFYLRP
jgi:hypothetical protein